MNNWFMLITFFSRGIKLQTGKRFKKNINTNETEMQVKDKISKTKPDNSTKSDTVLPSDLIIGKQNS